MSRIEQSAEASLPELRGVVAVATHRNFRRAASELGVSASALSHAIASLESRLQVKLFHRTTRSVSVSEAGERFLARIGPALAAIGEAIEGVNDFRSAPAGTLRINAARNAIDRIFEPVILPFLARYPDMRLDIVTDARLVDIVDGGFDAGIRLAESVPKDMISVPCSGPLRFVVAGAPACFAERGRPKHPEELANHRCIRRRMPSGRILPWELERGDQAIHVDVNGPLTLDTDDLMLKAALAGFGLVWANEWTLRDAIRRGLLERVLDEWCPPFPGICLYYPRHRHVSAGLRAFVETIRSAKLVTGRRR
jgi:DNA-binding transcriptional LysR family regulator